MKHLSPGTYGWRALAVAALMSCAASGCDEGGPTGPKPASLSDLFGGQLLRADGSSVGVQVLDDTPVIGIYFASPGCPACGGFTPILVDAYDQLRQDGRPFEVVLVGLSLGPSSLSEYMEDSEMSWLAVSAGGSKADALVNRYDVRWIPTLVIIDGSGNTISLNGRDELALGGLGAYDAWLAAGAGS